MVVQTSSGDESIRFLPAVLIVSVDMMITIQLQDAVERAGGRAVVVEDGNTDADVLAVIDRTLPALILMDLAYDGDSSMIIRRSKLQPHTQHIPICAFGSHVNADTLRAAREAGADHVWARSRMMQELAAIVDKCMNPPVRYPAGWDDELSATALAGIEAFNNGEYFKQHELLEQSWLEESRPIRKMVQGLLQVGVAFYHIENGNWSGAMKLFRRGLPKLRDLPPECQGIDLEEFRKDAAAVHLEIAELGPDRLGEFDQNHFPTIHFVE